MKLLQLKATATNGDDVFVLVQDDYTRGAELFYKKTKQVIRYFTLEMLLDCDWYGWVQLVPEQTRKTQQMWIANVSKKLKGHQKYAKAVLKELETN